MPVIETKGAASSGGFGQFARQVAANYIEDVFSTWLYTGNGSTQTITNGIDLSTKGGLVWLKDRGNANNHALYDTSRGATFELKTAATGTTGQTTQSTGLTSFTSSGFTIGSRAEFNTSSASCVSWTFRKEAKFFDIVTYTGNGAGSNRQISHNLGSSVGFIVVKRLNQDGWQWVAWHKDLGSNWIDLSASEMATSTNIATLFGDGSSFVAPTSSVFTVGSLLNQASATFVAYIFAHDAGGFGAAGTDNVISCGSYTGTGAAGNVITLGYEPQWLIIKNISTPTTNWVMVDNMRGMPATESAGTPRLSANSAAAEVNNNTVIPTATGFNPTGAGTFTNSSGHTFIYIAIRRGPMRTPTSGTSVFTSNAYTGTATTTEYNVGLVGDLSIVKRRTTSGEYTLAFDRLRGDSLTLALNRDWADTAPSYFGAGRLFPAFSSSGKQTVYQYRTSDTAWNASGVSYIDWFFKRAPGFFDVVCYIGDGNSDRSVPHNLSVKPELVIVKQRDVSVNGYSFPWKIYSKSIPDPDNNVMGFDSSGYGYRGPYGVKLSTTNATNLVVNAGYEVNEVSKRYVAYLFASCAGVSSVGSYTGTGTTQQINCGFTGGARFVLIKRIDPGSPYDWYVWDTARGIVAGNDPYLLLNSTAAEATGTDYIDTLSTGFEISNTAPEAINGSGGTFIYLAIA